MKRYSLIISTIVLGVLFWKLSNNYSNRVKDISNAYNTATSANLNLNTDFSAITKVIGTLDNFSHKDAEFAAKQIEEKFQKGNKLKSLYDLNKREWQIPSNVIDSIGSDGFKIKLEESKISLGQDNEYKQIKDEYYSNEVTLNSATNGVIKVKVVTLDDNIMAKLRGADKKGCPNVLVRLSEHYLDSLSVVRKTLAWARTNNTGTVIFKGLDINKSYSVLPIKEGFEYGMPKGTLKGSLIDSDKNGTLTYTFSQQEHKIRIFDARTITQIKEKHTLTVRTPQEYKSTLVLYIMLFFAVWWGLYILWVHKHKDSDNSIIAILMFLTGLCILTMFSINDPLEDTLLGIDMAQGVIAGVIVIGLMQSINFTNLYQNKFKIGFDIPLECIKWLFKPFRRKVAYLTQNLSNKKYGGFQKLISLLCIAVCLPLLLLDLIQVTKLHDKVDALTVKFPKGSSYLISALLLTALLWSPLGSEVGGMKVNLNLGIKFQPSEIAKYLIVFFMAAFFCLNANKIMKYSGKGNVGLFGDKIRMLATIIVGLGILMIMYLILGDMGPALVLAFTFIILYSIVKSKVDLENLDERNQNIKILTCDLAMLIYGVLSFIVFLYIGNAIGNMWIFCLAWFVLWIAFGLAKKQVFESAILFNLIISAFIFGGSLLNKVPISKLNDIGERLENRNEMCTNTWGTLPVNGMGADAGENTQVAEGLWGLASGGLWGQGLGNGSPNFIPAFHTDMILESIGEQLGFLGVFVVIFLLAILLRRAILIGYRTSHPFAFYLCLGISIVTAVQFIIISLGSTGIIPLTGVTVPFLSYGKVSMILNLAAFGVILSYTNGVVNETKSRSTIGQYNYSISLISWAYCGVTLFISCIFLYYQFIDRNETLIRPVYVHNVDGAPVIEYNPRIAQITNKMWAGDIYDRNGILLATSDRSKIANDKAIYKKLNLHCDTVKPQRRYYPFGEHLFFALGKYGSDVYSLTSENSGYVAEYRHMSELRGYDNKMYDSKGNPLKVTLISKDFKPDRFLSKERDTVDLQLRDYSVLIPYLKAGYNSDKILKMNARNEPFWAIGKIEPQDIYLTLDAKLQTLLQQRISDYVKENHSHLNKLRVSVVVLDAHNGDLLSSSIYPLPNEDRLREEKGTNVYSDMNKPSSWRAYSDMDLGLIFPSAPGSTAKILTGLAGFRKYKDDIAQKKYYVDKAEIIFPREPSGRMLTMKDAYRYSSNCYFINLLNDNDLFEDLAFTYGELGISINGKKSYSLQYEVPSNEWLSMVTAPGTNSIEVYKKYIESGIKEKMNKHKPDCWSWSWGQNGIDATPLAMARTISVVANNGMMPRTRFLLTDAKENVAIIENSEILRDYLKYTAQEHDQFHWDAIGGKTGTPERATETKTVKQKLKGGSEVENTIVKSKGNDGWYICFIDNVSISSKDNSTVSPIAIAIRMERLGEGDMSGKAVQLMKNVVRKTLEEIGYIK